MSTRELLDMAMLTKGMAVPAQDEALLAIVSAPSLTPTSKNHPEPLSELATYVRAAGGWNTGLMFEVSFDADTAVTHLRPSPQDVLAMSNVGEWAALHQRGFSMRRILCSDAGVFLPRHLFFPDAPDQQDNAREDLASQVDGSEQDGAARDAVDFRDRRFAKELGEFGWHVFFCPRPLLEAVQRTVFFQVAPLWLEMLGGEWAMLLREYQPLLQSRLQLESRGLPAPKTAQLRALEIRIEATCEAFRSLRHAHGHAMRVATARGDLGYLVQDESLIQYSLMCDPRNPMELPDSNSRWQELPLIAS